VYVRPSQDMNAESANPPAKASRRRPAEVRELLLDAAAQVFATKGLDGATTAEIALNAGVSESTLFRHFATKADLFTAAAVEPFQAFMDDFAEIWSRHQRGEDPDLMREFVTDLYDHLSERRDVVRALLMTDSALIVDRARGAFTRLFGDLQQIGDDWQQEQDEMIPALEIRERILIGMVTSMVMFDRWLLALPDGSMIEREAVVEALIAVARTGASESGRLRRRQN
jgi:AcrR family transcriptional regulator